MNSSDIISQMQNIFDSTETEKWTYKKVRELQIVLDGINPSESWQAHADFHSGIELCLTAMAMAH